MIFTWTYVGCDDVVAFLDRDLRFFLSRRAAEFGASERQR